MKSDKVKQKVPDVADTMPISDTACEEAILATLLSDVNAFDRLTDYLSKECFNDPKHQAIFNAIVSIVEAGGVADMTSVAMELMKSGGTANAMDVAALCGKGVNVLNQTNHAKHLMELATRRKLWQVGQELVNAGSCETLPLDEVQCRLKDGIDNIFDSQDSSVSTLRDGVNDLCTLVSNNIAGLKTDKTLTGFAKLDEVRGLMPSDLVIVAGDTSQGKSSFAQALTLSAIKQGQKIAFYSLEMTRLQLTARLVSMESDVPANRITDNALLNFEIERFNAAVESLPIDNLYFDDRSSSNLDTIIASIRSLQRKRGIAGVVIDYLQILTVNSNNKQSTEEQLLAEAARRLKNLAKEMNIFIILLSQLNRDGQNPLPKRERLRGSGQVAEAADMVLLVYRPEVYGVNYPKPYEAVSTHHTAMLRVCKNRNGALADFIVGFDPALTKFFDMAEGSLPQEKESDPFSI